MTPDPSRPLRIGVLGCGRLAQRVHLPALSRSTDFEVVGVADSSEGAAATAAAIAGGAPSFSSATELLESIELDAVLISVPPAAHAELAIAAFEAGVSVYLEKPLAGTVADGEAILRAWQESRRVGQIGFNYRFNPAVLEAKRLVAEGRVGDPVAVRSVFSSAPRAQSAWKRARATGGGVLLDLGSHHLDLIPWLLDRDVNEVSARLSTRRFEDDTATVSVELAGGLPVESLFVIGTHAEDRIEIYGTSGKVQVDRLDGTVEVRSPQDGSGRPDRTFREISTGVANVRRALRSSDEPSFGLALNAFAAAVRSQTTASPDLRDGQRALLLCDAAERSARTRAPVRIRDSGSATIEGGSVGPTPDSAPTTVAPEAYHGADLSVVLVTATDWTAIARTLEHVGHQTIRNRIELVLVGPAEAAFDAMPPELLAGYHSEQRVFVGPIDNLDLASAEGIRRSRSPIIGVVEDHAFPEPEWAEAIVRAHGESWSIVGSTFTNANPRSVLSWTNMLMAYGMWVDPAPGGEVAEVSRHNVSFKRSAVMEYDAELESLMGRGAGLLSRMAQDGHRSFLATDARLAHVNPSRLSSTVSLRVGAGRLKAAGRAARGRWPGWQRLIYVLGAPLIPVVLYRGMARVLFADERRRPLRRRGVPALMIGATLDAVGQMIGFAFGAGSTAETLAAFEFERIRHLRRSDRHVLTG